MYTFIVNPHSRSGLGELIWKELEQILHTKKVTYEVFFTKYQKHATTLAHQVTSDKKEHIVIALGGDGTVNEVINGIADYQKTIFGYIPIGSSNDFARGLGLPSSPAEALECILTAPRLRAIDIGILQYQHKQRKFAVSCGIGFDAAICHEATISRLKRFLNKCGLGKLTYAGIALHRLFLTRPQRVTFTLDHEHTIELRACYFVAVMNQKYEGGGLKFCPKAEPDDNYLDVIAIADLPKLKILALLPTAFKGWHTMFNGVKIYRCRHISLETEHALPVHTDGEPIFLQRQISASCSPDKLRIITPQ